MDSTLLQIPHRDQEVLAHRTIIETEHIPQNEHHSINSNNRDQNKIKGRRWLY